jgi:hypothetical protein
MMPSSVVPTIRTSRTVGQPRLWWRKDGLEPEIEWGVILVVYSFVWAIAALCQMMRNDKVANKA